MNIVLKMLIDYKILYKKSFNPELFAKKLILVGLNQI